MKKCTLLISSAFAMSFSLAALSEEPATKESQPIGKAKPITKEEVQQGIENGTLCTDAKGLADSRGAVITQNGKLYRCVKVYGENFKEIKKLVWVELTIKNGEAVTAD